MCIKWRPGQIAQDLYLRGQSNENMDFFFVSNFDSKTSKVMKKNIYLPKFLCKVVPQSPIFDKKKNWRK